MDSVWFVVDPIDNPQGVLSKLKSQKFSYFYQLNIKSTNKQIGRIRHL